mgnify:CR=1 FL=1
MSKVGKSEIRVDAFDKVTGRTKYYEDRMPAGALYARIKHSTIAHGFVKSVDKSAAEAIPGVVKVLTCFDVPEHCFPTAGHPWSMDPGHQDVADRNLLNRHVRYYGDDVAVVIAEDEVSAMQGVRALKVEYEELPFVLDVQKAMEPDAPCIHENFPGNILKHTDIRKGNYQQAIKEPGLIKVEGWYNTPTVQHSHIENHGCYAYEENGRIVIVSSTQIPHIIRRIVGQALGRPWADIRVIKPYIGGGFGNKQDALYEPLCAWCSTQVHGKCVRIDCSREETFVSNRVRHSIRFHIITWLHKDGSIAARKVECFSNQGAYASHGHSIVAKAMGSFPQIYPCDNFEGDAYTVYTNRPAAGAMRGYGMPQASFADDANIDECAKAVGMEPLEYRMKYIMPKGFHDGFSGNTNYYDSFRECLEKGKEYIEYDKKREEYAKDIGPVRRGIGVAAFWYNTAVYPISLETSSNRMLLNLDGTVTMQCGETEIGQGADTAYAQMTAEAVGLKSYHDVRVVSCQDTDITPTGLGAYASRQTYVAGFSIRQTATLLRQKILQYATKLTRQAVSNMDIVDGNIIRKGDGMVLMSLKDLAMTAQYNAADSEHITAESTYTIRNNAYSFGCTFADVEVDIPMCKVTLKKIINVHDCGKLINPALAEAQVHGGMSMAIGFGMSEQLLFDEKTGRPLNNNLLDYKLSTFMDHPHLEAQIIAGGSDVLVQMREGKRAGKELISIYGLDELRGVSIDEEENIRIGSLSSFSHITRDPIIQKYINVRGEAVDMVGGPQIRNIGTIGGNTCNGVTSADSASTLHAWEAIVELTGKDGIRRLPIKDFYIKAGQVDIRVEDGEIQTAILIPKASYENCYGYYIKYAMRNAMDIATLGCSVNVRLSPDKQTIERARIAYGVAGPVPMRCPSAEAAAKDKPLTLTTAEEFSLAVLNDIHARDSWRASKAFREHIAVEMAKRCLIESIKRAGGVIK